MKCNIPSIVQLLEKKYKVNMENWMLRVIDTKGNLVLKTPKSKNITFKIELDVMEHKCLLNATSRDEWLWHCKLGHLIFKDLNHMQRHKSMTGLLEIQIPDEICEDCVQSKQHKGKFPKML